MSEERRPFSAAWLAETLGGELRGRGDLAVTTVAAIDEAGPGALTFIADAAHARRWRASRADAAIITRGLDPWKPGEPEDDRALIVVNDAELAMNAVLELFQPPPALPDEGVHPSAFVHDEAVFGRNVRIGPHVSIGRGAVVDDRAVLHAGVRLYADVHIGESSELHSNVVVRERCRIGRRVILHQGVSIGGDGFGYRPSGGQHGAASTDPQTRTLVKVPHIGGVVIEDDVEIGANSCVDRGKFRDTRIGAGTKIDNLVQIAHNCNVGRGCVIAGQAGLAGSVTLGDGVQIGAQAGISEGVTMGDGSRLAAKSGLMRDVPPGVTMLGLPAEEGREALRQAASLRKLPGLIRDLSRPGTAGKPRKSSGRTGEM